MNDVRILPELVKSSPHAPIAQNIHPESSNLEKSQAHPQPPNRQAQALRVFIEFLLNLYEQDYGDFMREANAHLLDLKDALSLADVEVHKTLENMQDYTQFNAIWEVEPTRQRLIHDAEELLNYITRTQPTQSEGAIPLSHT